MAAKAEFFDKRMSATMAYHNESAP